MGSRPKVRRRPSTWYWRVPLAVSRISPVTRTLKMCDGAWPWVGDCGVCFFMVVLPFLRGKNPHGGLPECGGDAVDGVHAKGDEAGGEFFGLIEFQALGLSGDDEDGGPWTVGGGEDGVDGVFGAGLGLVVSDEVEGSLPEVCVGSETFFGAELFVGGPDGVGTGEDDQAFADVVAAHEFVAQDGVGHEPVDGGH